MNDPGLDKPINKTSIQIEKHPLTSDEAPHPSDNGQAFLDPSRWWFASTAFPLVAGTFGPMASAFSICALVQSWRVDIPPGANESHGSVKVSDPKW